MSDWREQLEQLAQQYDRRAAAASNEADRRLYSQQAADLRRELKSAEALK